MAATAGFSVAAPTPIHVLPSHHDVCPAAEAVDRPGHALAPLLLPDALRFTPKQFEAVCQAKPDAVLELDASGHVIHMTVAVRQDSETRRSVLLWIAGACSWAAAEGCATAPAAFACLMARCWLISLVRQER